MPISFSNKFYIKAGLLLGWLIIAFAAIPLLIQYIYDDVHPLFLQNVIAKHPHVTNAFLLAQWRDMAIFSTLTFLVFIVFTNFLRKPHLTQNIVGEATPGVLGAIRMLTCFILLINVFWEDLPSSAAIPRELIKPLGVMKLFYILPIGFENFVASPTALLIFQIATGLLLFLGMIGLFTRKVLPVAALFYMVFAGIFRQYAWFYHTGLIPVFVLFVLTLTPSSDGFSIDRFRSIWRTEDDSVDKASLKYGWARYAIWMVIAVPYVGAGLSKLRNGGLFWWDALNFKHIMFYSTLRPMEFDFDIALLFVNAPDFIVEVMAIVALLGEVLYGLVLFSPWARIILPGAMFVMHIGILFLQNILFFDLIFLQAVYWDFSKIRKFVGNSVNTKYGMLTFYYDVENNFWRKAVLLLRRMDLFERIEFAGDGSALNKKLPFVLHSDKTSDGISALAQISWRIPALWSIAPIVFILSKIGSSGESLLRFFEQKLLSTQPHEEQTKPLTFGTSPKLSIVILAILSLCWVFRIEFYPLTAMQMFSKFRRNIVQYELVKAHYASGEVDRAPIEQSIGAMSDSRYRRILKMAFSDKKRELCGKFLNACAERWNATAAPDQQIVKMEVQRWKWDFIGDKDNPKYGDLIENHTFTVKQMTPY